MKTPRSRAPSQTRPSAPERGERDANQALEEYRAQLASGPPRCGISRALKLLGDRWSLLILRDMVFDNRRTFGELLEHNPEGIASNILDARLKRLEAVGLIWRVPHPVDGRKNILRLTMAAIDLVPTLVELGNWAALYMQPNPAADVRTIELKYGGPQFLQAFLRDLAQTHRHARPPWMSYRRLAPQTGGPIAQALTAAHEAAVATLVERAGRLRTDWSVALRQMWTSDRGPAGTSRHRPAGRGSRGSSGRGPAGCRPENPSGPPSL